jgi:Uma2 family endonuclease
MSLVQTKFEVEYPESDGQPMGETDLHRDWMFRILELMRYRYRGQRVYTASNLLVYYEKGEPSKFVVPDDFVVKDCDPGRRRTFKIWEEGKSPDVVFEVTSLASRNDDASYKPHIYAKIRVKEYFLYDPTAEYLRPPLQGFRLMRRAYRRIEPDESGALECEELGFTLELDGSELVIRDSQSGQVLQTAAEAAEAARLAEKEARAAEKKILKAERAARRAAEKRAAELEAELQRLRDQLKRKTRSK